MLVSDGMIAAIDAMPAREPARGAARPAGESLLAIHVRQDGEQWIWMLIAEDGKAIATGRAGAREAALRLAQDAGWPVMGAAPTADRS